MKYDIVYVNVTPVPSTALYECKGCTFYGKKDCMCATKSLVDTCVDGEFIWKEV